jgi:hypothetical protein
MKQARLIKMCVNETCSEVRIGKHLSDSFPIQNGLEQGDALSPLLFNFALEYTISSSAPCSQTLSSPNEEFHDLYS